MKSTIKMWKELEVLILQQVVILLTSDQTKMYAAKEYNLLLVRTSGPRVAYSLSQECLRVCISPLPLTLHNFLYI
jgi:hypothetical protein